VPRPQDMQLAVFIQRVQRFQSLQRAKRCTSIPSRLAAELGSRRRGLPATAVQSRSLSWSAGAQLHHHKGGAFACWPRMSPARQERTLEDPADPDCLRPVRQAVQDWLPGDLPPPERPMLTLRTSRQHCRMCLW